MRKSLAEDVRKSSTMPKQKREEMVRECARLLRELIQVPQSEWNEDMGYRLTMARNFLRATGINPPPSPPA